MGAHACANTIVVKVTPKAWLPVGSLLTRKKR